MGNNQCIQSGWIAGCRQRIFVDFVRKGGFIELVIVVDYCVDGAIRTVVVKDCQTGIVDKSAVLDVPSYWLVE